MDPGNAAGRGSRWTSSPVVGFVAVAGLGVVLAAWIGSPYLTLGLARDVAEARTCLAAGDCGEAGPQSSLLWFYQGSLWIRVLAAWSFAALPVAWLVPFAILVAALASAVVFVMARAEGDGWAPVVSASVALVLFAGFSEMPVAQAPIIASLPQALFWWALGRTCRPGATPLHPAIAGVALALCLDTHLTSVILLPAAAAMLARSPRRGLATGILAASAVATVAALSPGALERNVECLVRHPVIPAAVAGSMAIAAAASIALGRGHDARVHVVAGPSDGGRVPWLDLLVLCLVIEAGATIATGHLWSMRYAMSAVVPAALIAGRACGWVASWMESARVRGSAWLTLALGVAVVLAAGKTLNEEEGWTYDDATRVLASLARRGVAPDEMMATIAGPRANRVLATLPVSGSGRLPRPAALTGSIRVVLRVHEDDAPIDTGPGIDVVRLAGPYRAVIATTPALVDRSRAHACIGRAGAWTTCTDIAPHRPDFVERLADGTGLGASLLPARHFSLDRDMSEIEFTMPLRRGDDMPHEVVVAPSLAEEGVWRIVAVTGCSFEGRLPGTRVRLFPPRATGASITFRATNPGQAWGDRDQWFPPYIEYRSGDATMERLAALVAAGVAE
jgi:hypothetical protein